MVTTVPGYAATDALSYLLNELEATSKTPVAGYHHVTPITQNTIGATFDVLRQQVFYGARHTEQIIRVLKGKLAGNVVQPEMANSAALYWLCALGKEIWMPSLTADTIAGGGATTTAGLTTIPLVNTAAVTYTPGALLSVASAASGLQELVQIAGITGNGAPGTSLTVKGLRATTPVVAATAVQQIPQHCFTTRGPLDTAVGWLPTMTLQKNVGMQWAWRLPGSLVSKLELKAAKEAVDMTATMVCTVDPLRLNPGTFEVFNPSANQRAELQRPFTVRDGYVVVNNDAAGTGASSLSALYQIEGWGLTWDNHTIDKDYWNQQRIKDSYPGVTSGTVTYNYTQTAGRPSGYEDYLALDGAPPIPFFQTVAINKSAPTTPAWQARGIYIPAMQVTKADNPENMNDLVSESIEASIVMDSLGSNPISVFVANDTAAAYTLY